MKFTKAPSAEARLTLPPGEFPPQNRLDFSPWKYSKEITAELKERPEEGNHFSWQLLRLTVQSRRAAAFVRSAGREAVIAWKQPQMQGSLQLLLHC